MTFTQVSAPILQISITSPSAGSYINLYNRAEFNVSGNCPVNGETISVTAGDGNHSVNAKTACASGNYSTNLDLTTSTDDSLVTMALSDGSVTITADRLDAAGNTLTRASVGVTQDTVAPDALTSVSLATGTSTPSRSATPTIRVVGVTNDLVVSIHADSSCNPLTQKGFGQSTNNSSVDITSDSLDEGFYYFYAMATDPAGNSSCTYALTYERDITAPTVAISSTNRADPTVMKVIPITVAFSEGVSGFTQSDLNISIGTISNSNFVDGAAFYSFDLTLPADSTGTFTIDIAAGKVKDLALNENAAAASYSKTFYTKTPTISGTTPTKDTTPDLTVDNIIAGLTAKIYTNSACTTEVGAASTIATDTSQVVAPSTPIFTSTTFYAATTDADSNKSACSPGFTLTLDVTAPTTAISGPSIASINNLGTVTYTITYGGADSVTLSNLNITQTTTGNATCSNATISGSGNSTRMVTLSSCTGDGTVKINVAAGTASDLAGNPAPSSGLSSAFTVDNIPPTVSITTPTNGSFINNSNVTSFSVGGACSEPGGQVTVKINGIATLGTPSCSGTGWSLSGLNMSAYADGAYTITANLSDAALNNAATASVTINKDTSAPTIALDSPSSTLINYLGTVTYTVSYSGANSVTLSDLNITKTATGNATCSNAAVSGSGNVSRTVTLSNCTGDGTVQINIAAGSASDSAGNTALAAGPSTAFTVDNTAPTVAIGSPSVFNTNASGSVSFTVNYVGANSVTLSDLNITKTATGNATCSNTAVSGGGNASRTVILSNCTGNGTIQINVAAGSASDSAGNTAPAAGPSTAFTVDNTAPTVAIGSPSVFNTNASGSVSFTVNYVGADSITLSNADITQAATGNAMCSNTAVSGGGNASRTVTLSNCTGDGTVRINIAAGTASDLTGNSASAAGPSALFTVDNTPPNSPSIAINSNASTTTTNNVTLTLSAQETASPPVQMCISDSENCSRPCTYESFTGPTMTKSNFVINSAVCSGNVNVSVKFMDAAGNVSSCAQSSITYTTSPAPVTVTAPYTTAYSTTNGAQWNDYVRSNNTAQACDGTETSFTACIHGGDQRIVTMPGAVTSCSQIASVSDTYLAFDWKCVPGSPVKFTSKLKTDKRLADLIDSTGPDWKQMRFDYTDTQGNTCAGTQSRWWSNLVAALPDNSLAADSAIPLPSSKIYILASSRGTAGYNITADKAAVVIYAGSTLSWNSNVTANNLLPSTGKIAAGTAKAVLAAGSQNFLWIEGAFDGTAATDYGVFLQGVRFSQLRHLSSSSNLRASPGFGRGIEIQHSKYNLLQDVRVANNRTEGILLYRTGFENDDNHFVGISAYNNGSGGISLQHTDNNTFSNIIVSDNGGNGLLLTDSFANRFVNLTAVNNGPGTASGIQLDSPYNVIHNAIASNNETKGITITSSSNTISQYASANNGGLDIDASAQTKFTSNILIQNSSNCSNNLLTGIEKQSGSCVLTSPSDGSLISSLDLSAAFKGKVGPTVAYASIGTSFLWFLNGFFQTWGVNGSTFPNSDNRGQCSSGSCQTWDWSLALPTSNPVLNRSGSGSSLNSSNNAGSYQFITDPATFACPSEVNGSNFVTSHNSTYSTYYSQQTFLKNAAEIIGDGIGDDDGLCESNENCLYTPNFGAYQGHGGLYECTFVPTNATDHLDYIRIFGYDTNGY